MAMEIWYSFFVLSLSPQIDQIFGWMSKKTSRISNHFCQSRRALTIEQSPPPLSFAAPQQNPQICSRIRFCLRSLGPDIFRVGLTGLVGFHFRIMFLDHDLGYLRGLCLETQTELQVVVLVGTIPERSKAVIVANVGSQG